MNLVDTKRTIRSSLGVQLAESENPYAEPKLTPIEYADWLKIRKDELSSHLTLLRPIINHMIDQIIKDTGGTSSAWPLTRTRSLATIGKSVEPGIYPVPDSINAYGKHPRFQKLYQLCLNFLQTQQ